MCRSAPPHSTPGLLQRLLDRTPLRRLSDIHTERLSIAPLSVRRNGLQRFAAFNARLRI